MAVVDEYEASGKIEEIYFEICQSLRVSGVNLIFRRLATDEEFFRKMWIEIEPLVVTREFCQAADRLRSEAISLASNLKKRKTKKYDVGESQGFQIQAALDLYHYVNPKLVLIASHLQFALAEQIQKDRRTQVLSKKIRRGIPERMFPMEMVSESSQDPVLKKVFPEIKKALGLKVLNSDYRSLGLWPQYLLEAWSEIKPLVQSDAYSQAVQDLKNRSRELVVGLPLPAVGERVDFSRLSNFKEIQKMVTYFENMLPGLVMNVALFELDWKSPETLKKSPFTEEWQTEREQEL